MDFPLIGRSAAPARKTTAGEHVGAVFRGLDAALLFAVVIAALLVVAALVGDGPLLIALAAAEVVVLITAFGLATYGYRDLRNGVVLPLAQLAASASRSEDPGTSVRGGTKDIQALATAIATLHDMLRHERGRRADDARARHVEMVAVREMFRFIKETGSTLEIGDVLRSTADGLLTVSRHANVVIWFVDEADRRLVPRYDSQAAAPIAPTIGSRPMADNSPAGRAATTGQTVTIRNDHTRPDRATGLAIPLTHGTGLTVLGVIELTDPVTEQVGADTIYGLESLAGHAALAIKASIEHEDSERRNETDGLTKVMNRRRLDADMRNEVARSRRSGHKLSLVMVDIDHFKDINDSFGHQQGDEVLKVIASTLNLECRATDGAYRFGGEEFALLLRDTDAAAAGEVADRIRLRLRDAVGALGLPREVTASMGVGALSAAVQTAEQLVEAADNALYQAKEGGRNRVVVSGQAIA